MEDVLKQFIREKAQTWAEQKKREWEKQFPSNLQTNAKDMTIVFDPALSVLVIIFISLKLFQLHREGKFKKDNPKSDYELRIDEVRDIVERIRIKIEKL